MAKEAAFKAVLDFQAIDKSLKEAEAALDAELRPDEDTGGFNRELIEKLNESRDELALNLTAAKANMDDLLKTNAELTNKLNQFKEKIEKEQSESQSS